MSAYKGARVKRKWWSFVGFLFSYTLWIGIWIGNTFKLMTKPIYIQSPETLQWIKVHRVYDVPIKSAGAHCSVRVLVLSMIDPTNQVLCWDHQEAESDRHCLWKNCWLIANTTLNKTRRTFQHRFFRNSKAFTSDWGLFDVKWMRQTVYQFEVFSTVCQHTVTRACNIDP